MSKLDKSDDQWTVFLKGHGLTTSTEVVKVVAERVVEGKSLYPLYSGRDRIPLAGKGTIYKIKRLIEAGKLDPILHHWGLTGVKPGEVEVDQIQLHHVVALMTFLKEDSRIRDSFLVSTPDWAIDFVLQQLQSGAKRILVPRVSMTWEGLPIVRNVRDHCPQHQLWDLIDDWKRRHSEYLGLKMKIGRSLFGEFRERLPFPFIEIGDREQERHLLMDVFNWVSGQLLGKVPHHGSLRSVPNNGRNDRESTFRLVWDGSIYAEGTEEQIDCSKRVVDEMLEQWSVSEIIRSLVDQYYSLLVLSQKIRDQLEQIDEAILGQGTCPDCPIMRHRKGCRED